MWSKRLEAALLGSAHGRLAQQICIVLARERRKPIGRFELELLQSGIARCAPRSQERHGASLSSSIDGTRASAELDCNLGHQKARLAESTCGTACSTANHGGECVKRATSISP